jgi:hypothetical protein
MWSPSGVQHGLLIPWRDYDPDVTIELGESTLNHVCVRLAPTIGRASRQVVKVGEQDLLWPEGLIKPAELVEQWGMGLQRGGPAEK